MNTTKQETITPALALNSLKETGEAPNWLTVEGYTVMSKGYLLKGETPRSAWKRVVSGGVKDYIGSERAERVFSYLWNGWLGLASPVFSNLNTTRGLPISCYSIHVEDSISGILDSTSELAVLAKHGGGVGVYWGDVRARGSLIQNGANGTSEGVIPFMHMQDATTLAVSQGSSRKGASAAYLPIEHADASEFIRMRRPLGDVNRQNLNIHHGVTITDDFMRSLKDPSHPKCKHNRELWKELLTTRLETGEPYIMFYDNVNKNLPECYKSRGLKVETSNLCLSKDTLVLTKEFGGVRIEDLVGKEVTIFDGENWVKNSSFRKTQNSAKLYRIRLSGGSFVDATSNHRWFAAPERLRMSEALTKKDGFKELTTGQLRVGMKLSFHMEESNRYCADFSMITAIEEVDGMHEVYCTTVPSTSKFALANGLMTGNCSEILLHTDNDHSFVCCLSSVNLEKYDEWKDNKNFIGDCVWFLDAVMEDFITKGKNIKGFERAVRFAENSRALGLGVLGWHSLLQKKSLPFDSFQSMMLNTEVFRRIQLDAVKASKELALEKGAPLWCSGLKEPVRNSHLISLAPTATNSVISGGVSPGIEPVVANAYLQKTAKGTFIKRNEALVPVLEKYNQNTEEVWKGITANNGSIAHLSFLTDHEKEVFKTAYEINQVSIVKQAASRQKYIDQGQSLNIFVPCTVNPKDFHDLHYLAWESGIRTLYYSRSTSITGAGMKSNINKDECKACEG